MSKLTWVLEKGCFEDSEPRLIESINKAGQAYEFVEYIPVVQETGRFNKQASSYEQAIEIMKRSIDKNEFDYKS